MVRNKVIDAITTFLPAITLAGRNAHGLGISLAILDGADIIAAPATIAQVAEITLAPGAIGGVVVGATVAVARPADLAVFVKGDDLGGAGREGEAEVGGAALAGVGAGAAGAGFVPEDDGEGGAAAVGEGVAVVVARGGCDELHVAAVGGADVADVGVDVGAGDGFRAASEAGGGTAGGVEEDGAGVGVGGGA